MKKILVVQDLFDPTYQIPAFASNIVEPLFMPTPILFAFGTSLPAVSFVYHFILDRFSV
jgi:hypothetical protein